MLRSVAVAIAVVLAVPALGHAGPRKTQRVVTVAYTGSCSVDVAGFATTVDTCEIHVPARTYEAYVRIDASDDSGLETPFQFWIGADFVGTGQAACGHSGAFKFKHGSTISVSPGVALPQCAGIATRGMLTFTFSDVP